MKLLFSNGDQDIGRDGAPDLRLHGVLAVAQKLLDSQMLLDLLEEQFDLPAALVKRCDGERRQGCVVGQEDQCLVGLGVFESNSAQVLGIVLGDINQSKFYAAPPQHPRSLRRCIFVRQHQQHARRTLSCIDVD